MTDYCPVAWWVPMGLPHVIEQLLAYTFAVSAALALLNMAPVYGLDGEAALRSLLQLGEPRGPVRSPQDQGKPAGGQDADQAGRHEYRHRHLCPAAGVTCAAVDRLRCGFDTNVSRREASPEVLCALGLTRRLPILGYISVYLSAGCGLASLPPASSYFILFWLAVQLAQLLFPVLLMPCKATWCHKAAESNSRIRTRTGFWSRPNSPGSEDGRSKEWKLNTAQPSQGRLLDGLPPALSGTVACSRSDEHSWTKCTSERMSSWQLYCCIV